MRLVLHREIPEDETLRAQWNALVQEMECPEVFYTYEWALAVARAYRASLTPLLMLAYEGGDLVGVVALATDPGGEKAFFLTRTTADYCDFVCSAQRRPELVDAVSAELRRLGIPGLVLANLPAGSATTRALLLSARRHGYSLFSRPAYFCAQVLLGSPGQRESTRQSVQHKQMLRRHLKAMAKIAPVRVDHRKTWEGITEVLPRFTEAHVNRFQAAGRNSNLADPQRQAFLAELAKLLSGAGWINLSSLMVGDEQVAWNYGFQFAGSWFWYQPTFDSRFQRHYPGLCLLGKIVEEACDHPEISRVDLGLGAEKYKEWLATGGQRTLHITATTSKAKYVREFTRYHAATVIKRVPLMENWARAALRWFSIL
ncbi:MAG: GNAT family N-acetyltransferase [Acidobacteriia bacterium]|nr:GNAT family N-acetyltransferase [Terriglobia bacterium]